MAVEELIIHLQRVAALDRKAHVLVSSEEFGNLGTVLSVQLDTYTHLCELYVDSLA